MPDQNDDDLWPNDIATPPDDKPPLVVLREQAGHLGAKTQNLVEAEVATSTELDGKLAMRFILVAPALSGYRYVLFTVVQGAEMYPVDLHFEGAAYKADNEEGLKKYLRNIFDSHTARRIIGGLVAQSRAS